MYNKIISFGLWGGDKKYTHGAILNVKLAKEYYPDYTCRFYINGTVPSKILTRLKSLDAQIWRPISICNNYKRYYRLSIMFAPPIDMFLIRDCDSRINAREAECVREWEASGYPVHIMRDHPRHTAPIMGGMWGAISNFLPARMLEDSLQRYTFKLSKGWRPVPSIGKSDGDQNYLRTEIWPSIKGNHLAHIRGKKLLHTDRNFPSSLKGKNFVGQIYDEHNVPQCEVNK